MKHNQIINEILDENILIKTVFVRKDGKLKMARRKFQSEKDLSGINKPMFPISKVRK